MKAIFRVWNYDLFNQNEKPLFTDIAEVEGVEIYDIVSHDVQVERIRLFNDRLQIYLDQRPARIDLDEESKQIHFLNDSFAEAFPGGYAMFDPKKVRVLYTKDNKVKSEGS